MTGLTEYLAATPQERFELFWDTRFPTNRLPTYWVDWSKATHMPSTAEIGLNTLNYLVGKGADAEHLAKSLFIEQPQLLSLVPILIASRDADFEVLFSTDDINALSYASDIKYYQLDFKHPDMDNLDTYMQFIRESGLLHFIAYDLDKSLTDYVKGVEVGLNSNARKNRGGTQNENMFNATLAELCAGTDWQYKSQATAQYILDAWGIVVPEVLAKGAKGGRRYDGAVFNPERNEVTVIETNFYGGGGSKLKAVSGEFSSLYETSLQRAPHVNFVWISDGKGWDTAKNPLREAFDVIPTIFNWRMIRDGYLDDVVVNGTPVAPVNY